MARIGLFLHMAVAAIFVIAGLTFTILAHNPIKVEAASLFPEIAPVTVAFPRLYLDPDNLMMWGLLAAIWLMVLLDATGQVIDRTDDEPIRSGRPRIRPMAFLALACAATWPMLIGSPLILTLVAAASAALATVAAHRAAGRHRPAIGFFAGWATAIASAALADLVSQQFILPPQAVSAVAILPAAALGMAAQVWIGPSVGYSTALIWAFCGLAISTMGSDPMIALTAILGISAMATVLIRAAS